MACFICANIENDMLQNYIKERLKMFLKFYPHSLF